MQKKYFDGGPPEGPFSPDGPHISIVRSTLEYRALIWDPYSQSDIDRVERIQWRGARVVKRDYKSRDSGCVTRMLKDLDLHTL